VRIAFAAVLACVPQFILIGSCPAAPAVAQSKKSIHEWAACDGSSDDTAGVAKAFAAAAHGAFTLIIDCSVRMQIGMDISHSVFIDAGTTVEFTRAGKFTVDNTFFPAFVIANSSDITLTDWVVQYEASLPVNSDVDGYLRNGKFVPAKQPAGRFIPAGGFSEERLTPWLAEHRRINFDNRQGHVTSVWTGPTNMCAIFFITGDSARIRVTNMRIGVPADAGGERFIPVAFSLNPNFKSDQTVTAKTPITAEFVAIPHDLIFANISLDGTYMGWVGSARNAVFENIHSLRYGDLQDAAGGNVGGMRKWFAPPHLLYLTRYAATTDPALSNRNIQIRNVLDEGVRIGRARDSAGEALSGNTLSLKIGCMNCSVDHYKSARPDGFLDVLSSDGLTISNAEATYNSDFLNGLYPGWRFPQAPYSNVSIENVSLKDDADSTQRLPVGNANLGSIEGLQLKNIHIDLNEW